MEIQRLTPHAAGPPSSELETLPEVYMRDAKSVEGQISGSFEHWRPRFEFWGTI